MHVKIKRDVSIYNSSENFDFLSREDDKILDDKTPFVFSYGEDVRGFLS